MKLKVFSFLVLAACVADAALVTGRDGAALVDANGNLLVSRQDFVNAVQRPGFWTKSKALEFANLPTPAQKVEFAQRYSGEAGIDTSVLGPTAEQRRRKMRLRAGFLASANDRQKMDNQRRVGELAAQDAALIAEARMEKRDTAATKIQAGFRGHKARQALAYGSFEQYLKYTKRLNEINKGTKRLESQVDEILKTVEKEQHTVDTSRDETRRASAQRRLDNLRPALESLLEKIHKVTQDYASLEEKMDEARANVLRARTESSIGHQMLPAVQEFDRRSARLREIQEGELKNLRGYEELLRQVGSSTVNIEDVRRHWEQFIHSSRRNLDMAAAELHGIEAEQAALRQELLERREQRNEAAKRIQRAVRARHEAPVRAREAAEIDAVLPYGSEDSEGEGGEEY